MRKIKSVTVVTEDGRTVELGAGTAHLVKTKTPEGNPVARVEVTVPVNAEWASGEGGRYIKTEVDL
jgi:hypothetical protein